MELYRGMWCAFLITMYLAFKASASQIIGHGNRSAEYGEDAYYKCKLEDPKDVLQVTWQRVFKDNPIENLATYSKRFGEQVNDPYKGKILFTEALTGAGLKNCSLVVQNVTEQDEGCYLCLFITSSDVANTGRTCLQMYELYGPTLNVTSLNSTGEQVVSCSATGRPAPKITLHVPQRHMTHNSSVTNSNGTVTVVSTAVISHRDTHITCSGTSPFEVKQVNTTVPDIKLMRNTASGPSAMDPYLAPCIFLSCGSVVVGIVAAVLLVKKNHNKERFVTFHSVQREHKNMENGNGITPLKNNIKEENSSLRNRTPVKNESSAKKSSRKLVL
ncbi:OX-2 membrane glycoprotein-like isoform X4 [Boleophthalmus pectinirostris]|uniref:OX-2 membrane glycoprotein-like isoform X4 n=1 Tax=Boleophthalmus pectinirostris TaxID=150288 RepID=UPI002430F221|nr:OX-2 membrane glycoprotein-like isoform X4 [Boleophthalmus pectinirostris]